LVGLAVARQLLRHEPKAIIISALTRNEAEAALDELRREGAVPAGTELHAAWGDLFLPEALKDRSLPEVLADPPARAQLLDDLYGEPVEDPLPHAALGALLLRYEPDIVVDCVNTATAVAYQNVFAAAGRLRASATEGQLGLDEIEPLLATLYLPRLIRHVQIAHEGMRRVGTAIYLKIGTAGTGGMGLNIPFTHSEERPSRALLAKAGVAGAHTLFLFLMARTPGGPAVKEIKPTAAISWKRIAYGEVRRRGQPLERSDATRPLLLHEAFGPDAAGAYSPAGGTLEGVFLDAGENGLFSLGEFEALTNLGLMEFITPEEIAENVEREIRGHPTGKDVVAALDASTSGPTYRAGVLREAALDRMEALERERGIYAVAYEMLGPPRLTKLLFEAAIIDRLFPDLQTAAQLDPEETATFAEALIEQDAELRIRALTAGLPILLADGARLLRGAQVRIAPAPGQQPDDIRLRDNGWVDLRAENWSRWRTRIATIAADLAANPGADRGSRVDIEPASRAGHIRPGRLAAWVFRYEDQGGRVKR
jgi:hypothetical protein